MITIIKNQQTPKVETPVDTTELLWYDCRLGEFLKFASAQKNLVGLAANQVAFDGERFMLRCFAMKRFKNNRNNDWEIILFPTIVEYLDEKISTKEGCATWPGKKILAERHSRLKVRYYNAEMQLVNEEVNGIEAAIWQHEMNHLDGIEENVISTTIVNKQNGVGRNDKCPCGSGKKFKNCCMER